LASAAEQPESRSMASQDTEQQRLLASYESATPTERRIVQMLAINDDTVACSPLAQCLRKGDIHHPETGKGFAHKSLLPVLERMVDKKLIENHNGKFRCPPPIAELIARRTVAEGIFETLADAVQTTIVTQKWGDRLTFRSYRQGVRDVRIALYRHDVELVHEMLTACARQYPREYAAEHPYWLIAGRSFDPDWLRTLPEPLLGEILAVLLTLAMERLEPDPAMIEFAAKLYANGVCQAMLRYPLAEQWLLQGQPARVRKLLNADENLDTLLLRGWLAFLDDENDKALELFEEAYKILQKSTRKRVIFFDDLSGAMFILALLASDDAERLRQAEDYLGVLDKSSYRMSSVYGMLRHVVRAQRGQPQYYAHLMNMLDTTAPPDSDQVFELLALRWLDPAVAAKTLQQPALQLLRAADRAGYVWLAQIMAEWLCAAGSQDHCVQAQQYRERTGVRRNLAQLLEPKEPWEHALTALVELGQPKAAAPPGATLRLVWRLQWHQSGKCTLIPREQKRDAQGRWTRGRPIAIKRLYGDADKISYLTAQDRQLCHSSIIRHRDRYYGSYYDGGYEIDSNKALPQLVGHPLVFWEDAPDVRVEVVKGEPELLVTQEGNYFHIALSPPLATDAAVVAAKETPTRLKVIEITEAHRHIDAILGNGLRVPAAAKDRVLDAIAAVSTEVTVQSSIGGVLENLEEVPADARPHVHLLPFDEGLRIALRVRPLAPGGPYYRPGGGGAQVIAEVHEKRLQTQRDLTLERRQAEAVIAAAPTLSRQPAADWEWTLVDPEDCLEALEELQALGEQVTLEWPEGEKFKISQRASTSQFRIVIRRQQDWFGASGQLQLDDQQTLDMQRLLEFIRQSPGRFLPLGEGQFLALTREFRKRLEELNSFAEPTAKGVRFHPLAALALEDVTQSVGAVQADKHWQTHMRRLREAESLQPEVPSTFQGELRDYQLVGFQWLARLAHWGVGACLADDMGLGKTIQALALLLTRAPDGPALVVAPTSVGMNWLDEARRFAPTLNAQLFGGGDREQMLDALGPFDLLVCSYGLLQQESQLLAGRQWHSIVLDEAQAIKNMATKRSQAAMALSGDFKMIATGTPIENHLGELWNLFRFINPGLLGSLERFNERFANPIEREHDERARTRLKKLIQPFMLRRNKAQVLEELPARTEILLRVEMSTEETALYEALRQEALQRLAAPELTQEQRPFVILAEIMKLRRACCNPRLVVPDLSLPSAKLNTFQELLDELLENRHKALVFSQFVDHLSILRETLDARGVAYQYLDGATPAAERKRRVDAFQAGEGEAFLISLKAGGLGLNLTAADYVIHMDPWWNPAVEDQAADRAHRIGQQRPVTIYRLVIKNTIEEKIVELHRQKRDLADSLLEGGDAGGRLSAEALLALLREE